MSDDDRWELHEQLAEGLSADPDQAATLGEALGLDAEEVGDVALALAALGAATEFDPPDPTLAAQLSDGEHIGDYEILEQIGRGGFGVVYRARDPVLNVDVALKLIAAPPGVVDEVQERFEREARAVARLDHPHIVRVRTAGWDPRGPYLVMDFVPGESLHRRLEREGPLPAAEAVRIARQLAEALDHAHAQGVLHRDVKPDNVLVTPDGVARLTDFGLARDALAGGESQVSQAGHALGTPGYWPPEQARGDLEAIGPTSDVYGLGATLYALLTGRAPYTGPHTLAILEAMARRAPVPPPSSLRDDLDRGLDAMCARCLDHDPQARYPSATALAAALADWNPDATPQRARPGLVALALFAPVLLALAALFAFNGDVPPPTAPAKPPPAQPAPADPPPSVAPTTTASPASVASERWWARTPSWRQLTVSGPAINAEATLVSDPLAQRVLVFGGQARKSASAALWAWDGDRWAEIETPTPRPGPRTHAAGVYDLRRERLVIFGGRDGRWRDDLWEWDGVRWSSASLPAKAAHKRPLAAYDARRGVSVVLFGREVWEWDGQSWTLKPSPPAHGRQLVYSAASEQVLLLGQQGRLWDYDGTAWNGASSPLPQKIRVAWAVATDQAVLALIGSKPGKRLGTLETWLYRNARWHRLDAGDPGLQQLAGLAWVPGRDHALTLGGDRKRRSPVYTVTLAPSR